MCGIVGYTGPRDAAPILLKSIGMTHEQILATFFEFDTFHFSKKGILFEVVPERLRGEVAKFDILKTEQVASAQEMAETSAMLPR